MHRYRSPAGHSAYPPAIESGTGSQPDFVRDEDLTGSDEGEIIPYAHRDIKPGYVEISAELVLSQKHHDRR